MLSYIYRLIRGFEYEHGIFPNLLYINQDHAEHLNELFEGHPHPPTLSDVLGMEVVVNRDVVQPHVVWAQSAARRAG